MGRGIWYGREWVGMGLRMRSLWLLFVILLVFGAQAGVRAAPASQDVYLLGPGDTIEVSIFGEPDLTRTVTVKPDGTISLPLIGEVKAAGKTTSQLVAELATLYRKYLRAPVISVVIREFRVDRIYILGQINRPGEYQVRPGMGILEILASAGGPTTRADLTKAVIIRGRTEALQLNLLEAFAKNKSPDVKLLPGDVLFIPETDRRIVVLGQVNRPGAYDLLEGQRVADLLAAAGGLTARAALPRAFLVRGPEQVSVDLQKILAGDVAANIPLRPGDMLVVPEIQNRIAVLGAVNRPGTFDLQDGMKLVDAIALAGGRTDRGNLSQVVIVRLEGGQTKTITANVDQALRGQDANQNVALQHGDIVYVPERGFDLGSITQYLNTFNLIRILFGGLF